jgi:hypothetical protein
MMLCDFFEIRYLRAMKNGKFNSELVLQAQNLDKNYVGYFSNIILTYYTRTMICMKLLHFSRLFPRFYHQAGSGFVGYRSVEVI